MFLTKQAEICSENGGVICSAKGKHCPSNGKTSGCFALFGEKKEEKKASKGRNFLKKDSFGLQLFFLYVYLVKSF